MRASRYLNIREDEHGMLRLAGVLDPVTGAPIKAAIEALVTKMIRARRNGADGTDSHPTDNPTPTIRAKNIGEVLADDRSVPQMQADALAMIAGHVLGCARMPSGPAVTMVVRTELTTLIEGIGHGQIDGLSQPVSAGTIRKMAATAGLIPAVFGGESLPLDLGRMRGCSPGRNASRWQNAMAGARVADSTWPTPKPITSTGGNATTGPPT